MSSVCFTTTEDTTDGMFISGKRPDQESTVEDLLTEDRLTVIFLASLAPSQLTLRQILPIHITEMTHGYIASFIEANIHSSGETEWEAIDNLKALIIDAYQMLQDIEQSALGPMPSKQLAILQSFIQ
jgi:hypothetical protein